MVELEIKATVKVLYCETPLTMLSIAELLQEHISLKTIVRLKKNEGWVKKIKKEISSRAVLQPPTIDTLDNVVKQTIINTLLKTKGNRRQAAKLLNISERTIYRKIEEYGIE